MSRGRHPKAEIHSRRNDGREGIDLTGKMWYNYRITAKEREIKMKKRIISVVLMLAMLLCLTACSGGDEKKLVGTWESRMDLADQINTEMALDEMSAQYLEFDSFELLVCMKFNSDGTYSMYADLDSAEAALEDARAHLADGMVEYLEMLMLEQMGIEMSAEDILAASNMTMDDMIAEILPDSMAQELVDEIAQEGNFEARDGKLYTSAGLAYAVDPEIYETYVLNGSTLTITGFVGEGSEDSVNVYPMVFNKVG